MGYYGGARLPYASVLDVLSAKAGGDRESPFRKLDHGGFICESQPVAWKLCHCAFWKLCCLLSCVSKTIHYTYRALISPLFLNPSMSPIHISVWASALSFQLINATCIGGWLGGYGPTTKEEWAGTAMRVELGLMIFGIGLLGNMYHDDELREIRRAAARNQKRKQEEKGEKANGKGVDKVYMVPENGLFRSVLFPHYLCEWIEWGGFWMVGGLACVPARSFLVNEITAMLPRALSGKQWYVERFGKEKIGSRKAVIPGII